MKPAFFLLLFVPLVMMASVSEAQSIKKEKAAFVAMLGDDTLAVEQFQYTATGMQAEVVLRTPRTTMHRYTLDLDEAGGIRRYEVIVREPDQPEDTQPLRHEVYVPLGDSIKVAITENGKTERQAFSATTHMLPFIDMIHWPFELMLMRALSSGQESFTQDLFTSRGVQPFIVTNRGRGRMTVTHPYRGTMEVLVSPEGRLQSLDAANSTRKLVVKRVPEVDIHALARRFAERDAAGQTFGPLSGRGEVTTQVKGATIRVDYGRPAKRGRDVFGSLAPWGQVWRTGANQATHFETDRPLLMEGFEIPAGEYTLFTIPEPEGGVLIINRQTGQGGTAYDPERDLGRVKMQLSTLPETVEVFTIQVEETQAGGELQLKWDKTAFVIPFTVKD